MTGKNTPTVLTLATKITIARILGVPVFILLLVYYIQGLKHGDVHEYERMAALLLFLCVAVTDALDGYFARSRNEVTRLGRLLDPVADKALLLSALVLLTKPSLPALSPQMPIWFTTLVISRDVVLTAGSLLIYFTAGTMEIRPHMSGKIATVLQMLTIVWALSGWRYPHFLWLVSAAGFFTAFAGVHYLFDGLRQLEKATPNG